MSEDFFLEGTEMSTDANKEVVRRFMDEVQSGKNLDVMDELFSPDTLILGAPAENGDPIGLIKSVLQTLFDGFPDLHVELLKMVAEGDTVATLKMFRGTHLGEFRGVQPTGRKVEFDALEFVVLRDGKIVDHWGAPRFALLMKQIRN